MKKLLIANRGEIAIRIARTARRMNFKVVGLFTKQDAKSAHLDFCDEVIDLGSGSLGETYLNGPKILSEAQKLQVNFLHPGYGFLSEKAEFARSCEQNGICFVGPTHESMNSMGDKIRSKEFMKKLGVPLVPGSDGPVSGLQEAQKVAQKLGYPLLIKASAGGGGKGMRVVRSDDQLSSALESAAREAKSYFGDATIFIEKYIDSPHHVEVQVMGDGQGGGGHVFDRECSLQRRHQKILEECPSPLLQKFPKSRNRLLELATHVVGAMKYRSAGTLEFVADEQGEFYFLEMNTRLQVEHPVTEWYTGLDLVELQLRVAQGELLPKGPLVQAPHGHALEVRIYAETPFEFLPTGGTVHEMNLPQGPGIRIDTSVVPGFTVPLDYDPTLLKLSVWGSDRAQAISRLKQALEEMRILGVESNQGLFWSIVQNEKFNHGIYSTWFLEEEKQDLKSRYDRAHQLLMEQSSAVLLKQKQPQQSSKQSNDSVSSEIQLSPWTYFARRSL